MADDIAGLQQAIAEAAATGGNQAGEAAVWAGVKVVESPWRSLDSDAKPVVAQTAQLTAEVSTAMPRGVFQEGGGLPAVLRVDPTPEMARVAAEAGAAMFR